MREVGVHLDHHVVAACEPDAEPGAVRGAEAGLRRASQHVDAAQQLAELLGLVGGAVGTAVVDHQDVGVGQRDAGALEHVLDVLDLVVRRQHHEDAHRGRAYRPGSCELLHGNTIGRWPMPPEPATPTGGADPADAPVPRGAFLLAFGGVVLAGILGGIIGYGIADVSSQSDISHLIGTFIGVADRRRRCRHRRGARAAGHGRVAPPEPARPDPARSSETGVVGQGPKVSLRNGSA